MRATRHGFALAVGLVCAATVTSLPPSAAAQGWLLPEPEAGGPASVPQPAADPDHLTHRLDRLEAVVRRLGREVEALRRQLGGGEIAEIRELPTPAAAPRARGDAGQPRASRPPVAEPAGHAVAQGPPMSLLPLPRHALPGPPVATGANAGTAVAALPQAPAPAPLRGGQPHSETSIESAALAPVVDHGAEAEYAAAYAHLLADEMAEAGDAFAAFIRRNPGHELAGNAQYWLAETHFARADYQTAAREFLTGYTRFGSSPKAPDSLLKLGLTLSALGRHDEACAAFTEMAKRFPGADPSVHERSAAEAANAGC